ncbi:hypothetical protein [Roseivirga sp. E12]|uniref:hypothetical protein n=1 Tax=Roseivirga sp. E12 TaxID=2819237 RepID=UPI001ABC819F|nr:hypothetical protein [Roseivirga sp. E12]MBO3699682.1 hypothetical protein [Roseivirga sp. E12]
MKSPKVNTKNNNSPKVRNLSAIIAIMLAVVTLFQAGTVKSNDLNREVSVMEAQLIAEIEQFLEEEEEMGIEEEIYMEMETEAIEDVNVFDSNDNLIASGNPANDKELRKLVNQADYLSSLGSNKYYRLSK